MKQGKEKSEKDEKQIEDGGGGGGGGGGEGAGERILSLISRKEGLVLHEGHGGGESEKQGM